MSPETGRVVDEDFFSLLDDAGIAVPQVPVDERRLYLPAVALQRSKKPGNDDLKERRDEGIELRVGPGPLFSKPQDVAKTIGEELLPAIKPRVVLGQVAIVRHALEAELLPVGRLVYVEIGELLAERVRGGELPLGEVVEVAQAKVLVGVVLEGAPSNGLWTEAERDGVDG